MVLGSGRQWSHSILSYIPRMSYRQFPAKWALVRSSVQSWESWRRLVPMALCRDLQVAD